MIRMTAALAACACIALPLSAEAGQRYGGSSHWKPAPHGQGVMRVYAPAIYNSDVYASPPAYHGGHFQGGLNVETRRDYHDNYASEPAYYRPHDCKTVCVAVAPPLPPPVSSCHKRRYDERVIEHREDYAYEREERYDDGYGQRVYREARYEPRRYQEDCLCHGELVRYDDSYRREESYTEYREERYVRHDVFGRY